MWILNLYFVFKNWSCAKTSLGPISRMWDNLDTFFDSYFDMSDIFSHKCKQMFIYRVFNVNQYEKEGADHWTTNNSYFCFSCYNVGIVILYKVRLVL